MAQVVILGQGAIGSMLAFECQQQNLAHRILPHNQWKPMRVRDGDRSIDIVNSSRQDISQPAMILVPLKAHAIADALAMHKHRWPASTPVVLMNNGMGVAEQVLANWPEMPLVAVITRRGARRTTSTSTELTGKGLSIGGNVSASPRQFQLVKDLLNVLLAPFEWHTHIQQAQWDKLAINAIINPLTAKYNVRNGELLAAHFTPEIRALCEEISAVITACGFIANPAVLFQQVTDVAKATAVNYSSMHQDVHFNRATEINYINGHIVRCGQRTSTPTPLNAKLISEILGGTQRR